MDKEKTIPLQNPEDIKKEEFSKPITFRADRETYSNILSLEKTRKETKSEIIKSAINDSFEKLISKRINSKIFDTMKESFGKISVNIIGLSFGGSLDNTIREDGEEEINPFESSNSRDEEKDIIIYKIKENPSFKSKDKDFHSSLSSFNIETAHEPRNKIRIKIIQPNVLFGNAKDFDPEIFLKINNIATENNLKIETIKDAKKTSVAITHESDIPIIVINEWFEELKEIISYFKKADKEIEKEIRKSKKLDEIKTSKKLDEIKTSKHVPKLIKK